MATQRATAAVSSKQHDSVEGEKLTCRRVPVCLIRPYRKKDEMQVKTLLEDAAMETVSAYFMQAALSTLTPQLCFLGFAFAFLVFHWPFYGCVSLMPVPVLLLYLFIWSAHYMKALELRMDASNIENAYMSESATNFYVAEVYDNVLSTEFSAHLNTSKKVEYDFITQDQLGSEKLSDQFKHQTIVGCMGVTRNELCEEKAWLKRLTTHQLYRRRGIASHLLEEAIRFCGLHNYGVLELAATDCHAEAHPLFDKRGFSSMMSHRGLMGFSQQRFVYSLPIRARDTIPVTEETPSPAQKVDKKSD